MSHLENCDCHCHKMFDAVFSCGDCGYEDKEHMCYICKSDVRMVGGRGGPNIETICNICLRGETIKQ